LEAKEITDIIIQRKIEVAYPKGRKIKVKRFPTSYEIDHKKYLRSKMIEVSELTTHNELEVKLYNKREQDSVKVISGGLHDFNEVIPSGALIDIKMKSADKELAQDINDVVRELSKKYLKPCICYTGRYTINVKIDNADFTEQVANIFYEDFAKEIKKRVEHYGTVGLEETPNNIIENDNKVTPKEKESFWKRLRGKK